MYLKDVFYPWTILKIKASKLFLMKSEDNNNIVLVYKNNIKIFTTKANSSKAYNLKFQKQIKIL